MAEERRRRVPREGVVARTEWLAPTMVRLVLTGPDVAAIPELTYTDHYVKLLFPPAGADYGWPFDPDGLRETAAPELWPVTRTYTIRSFDRERNELAVDFVVHGSEGLAGPWAAAATVGDRIGFFGPGGGYAPDPTRSCHLMAGDEAALPAIAAALEALPEHARVQVFLEVAGPEDEQPVRRTAGTTVTWVHRGAQTPGHALCEAVRAADLDLDRPQVFVHGNAYMVRDLRRHLFTERRLDRTGASVSGYWRTGDTEDMWQAGKRAFNQQMEAEEAAASAA